MDTHDTGDPRLWGSPLVRVMGYERVGLRHFVARFLSVGAGRRPLYETMGYQDLSYGLYEANISPENLIWVDDTAAAARYACIERVYARIRPFLDSAKIVERQTGAELAWWIIRGSDPSRVVACAASLETADGNDLGRFLIPTSQIESGAELQGRMYDFSDPAGEPYSIHGDIVVEHLPFLGFRVFDLNPEFF
ncbi:MAG: hypothetical protein NT080_03685 [Spirochaetes bacterium]|nr:hypothetical protein [Spirochaetota bacterium]